MGEIVKKMKQEVNRRDDTNVTRTRTPTRHHRRRVKLLT